MLNSVCRQANIGSFLRFHRPSLMHIMTCPSPPAQLVRLHGKRIPSQTRQEPLFGKFKYNGARLGFGHATSFPLASSCVTHGLQARHQPGVDPGRTRACAKKKMLDEHHSWASSSSSYTDLPSLVLSTTWCVMSRNGTAAVGAHEGMKKVECQGCSGGRVGIWWELVVDGVAAQCAMEDVGQALGKIGMGDQALR